MEDMPSMGSMPAMGGMPPKGLLPMRNQDMPPWRLDPHGGMTSMGA